MTAAKASATTVNSAAPAHTTATMTATSTRIGMAIAQPNAESERSWSNNSNEPSIPPLSCSVAKPIASATMRSTTASVMRSVREAGGREVVFILGSREDLIDDGRSLRRAKARDNALPMNCRIRGAGGCRRVGSTKKAGRARLLEAISDLSRAIWQRVSQALSRVFLSASVSMSPAFPTSRSETDPAA